MCVQPQAQNEEVSSGLHTGAACSAELTVSGFCWNGVVYCVCVCVCVCGWEREWVCVCVCGSTLVFYDEMHLNFLGSWFIINTKKRKRDHLWCQEHQTYRGHQPVTSVCVCVCVCVCLILHDIRHLKGINPVLERLLCLFDSQTDSSVYRVSVLCCVSPRCRL